MNKHGDMNEHEESLGGGINEHEANAGGVNNRRGYKQAQGLQMTAGSTNEHGDMNEQGAMSVGRYEHGRGSSRGSMPLSPSLLLLPAWELPV